MKIIGVPDICTIFKVDTKVFVLNNNMPADYRRNFLFFQQGQTDIVRMKQQYNVIETMNMIMSNKCGNFYI